jgi:hypothetical protein
VRNCRLDCDSKESTNSTEPDTATDSTGTLEPDVEAPGIVNKDYPSEVLEADDHNDRTTKSQMLLGDAEPQLYLCFRNDT